MHPDNAVDGIGDSPTHRPERYGAIVYDIDGRVAKDDKDICCKQYGQKHDSSPNPPHSICKEDDGNQKHRGDGSSTDIRERPPVGHPESLHNLYRS